MHPDLLDNIPFSIDRSELRARLRLRPNSPHQDLFDSLCDQAERLGRPKAAFKLAFIDEKGPDYVTFEGIRFTSRVLRVNLEPAQRAFILLATCGLELDAWAKSFDDLLARFWADAISEAALYSASQSLFAHLAQRYQADQLANMTPGSIDDWPLSEQVPLFQLLEDAPAAIGVQLTDSLLMLPSKSVSMLAFPTEARFETCQLCPRQICPNRRAPYDPELYQRKYQVTG